MKYPRLRRDGLLLKRIFDLGVTVVALFLLSPLLISIAFLIWLRMGRPIFFRQLRPGLYSQLFFVYKFRTMDDRPDEHGNRRPDADRITRIGRFLRTTSLDELPELWNVLKGDMSLVGPRPLLADYLELYTPEQTRRHEVPPGLTGWAQVNGRNTLSWEEKFDLDIWYVENRSFLLDLRILFLTVWKVLSREGVSHFSDTPWPRFRGSSRNNGGKENCGAQDG